MEKGILFVLLFGFGLGLKHAIEADHVAAVSTIVAERKSVLSSALVGGFWGVGHTLTLLAVGIFLMIFRVTIPESLEAKLEGIVGIMLIVLGANALRKLFSKENTHLHSHKHGDKTHLHVHSHDDEVESESHHILKRSPRSVVIGMVHGLAGSAALMLFIVPTFESPAIALFYIVIFGIGSIVGMMLMSVLVGFPIYFTSGRFEKLNRSLLGLAGLFSFGLGLTIVYEKLIA